MIKMIVDLHCHEKTGSNDCGYSMNEMYQFFRDYFDTNDVLIGFVGHDSLPREKAPRNCIKGVEHTINEENDFHIIEYPNYDSGSWLIPYTPLRGMREK